jgi:hypothetical protein
MPIRTIFDRIPAKLARKLTPQALRRTFTPGMAKRLPSAGPFAAGVMVQGKWVDDGKLDQLTVPTGTLIASRFYPNMDLNQGSIVLWLTPEWAGNDSKYHYIFRAATASAGNSLLILKLNSNYIQVGIGAQVASQSTTSWTAGTTYCIVARWDLQNTLDGTNYLCISVNDVHTFAATSAPTDPVTTSLLYIGLRDAPNFAADALLQGLTVYRRPLWDGAYGCDVGNGDEINLIYNAGTGTDPTEITGSWDVCFCLPTNATPGALTTGSVDAWSHPHSSEALTDAFCQRAYASSAWADTGTPVALPSVEFLTASATKIDCGTESTVDNLPDNEVTIEGWFRGSIISAAIVAKGTGTGSGWLVFVDINSTLTFRVSNTTPTIFGVTPSTVVRDNRWHHFAAYFNDAGDRFPYLAIDGIWTKGATALTGTVFDDSSYTMYYGRRGDAAWYLTGALGWQRISNNARYTPGTNFTPPPRGIVPASDGNTVRLFPMNEGSGTDIADLSANDQHGTLSNGTWNNSRDLSVGSPGERVYQFGYEFGGGT